MLATGSAGQERLDRIEECYGHFNQSLLEAIPPLPENAQILSIGCGTGTRECKMAIYWPHAHITALDNSEDQLMLARERAFKLNLTNIDFVVGDAYSLPDINRHDLVYARFLLMHMRDPSSIIKGMVRTAKLGGLVICEELSSSSFFCEPDNQFYKQAFDLSQDVAQKMGVDYDIGKKLSVLMAEHGLTSVKLNQLQPDRSNSNAKLQLYFGIAEAKPRLTSVGYEEEALNSLLANMLEFANEENSRISMSDLFQAVGYKPLSLS